MWYYNTCKEQENKVVKEKENNTMGISRKISDIKEYLFDLWETTHFVKINNTVFNADTTILTYNIDKQYFELFRLTNDDFENPILSFKKEDVITVNNQKIILDDDVKNIINERWKTARCMKINNFLFFMNECYNLFISNKLLIYRHGVGTEINVEEIDSLIIDEERVL